ncbi:hypothetical protein CEXT_293671 [Caerostris extrusa]|uniref:Uncharacterized protein n=1 Tax=Caerostris extrusa TaxID=172846 RepID=A0AAV4UUL0_CAEEX|nr:hypothetical protein CEXT_293671 [Caerostris extrusa]
MPRFPISLGQKKKKKRSPDNCGNKQERHPIDMVPRNICHILSSPIAAVRFCARPVIRRAINPRPPQTILNDVHVDTAGRKSRGKGGGKAIT